MYSEMNTIEKNKTRIVVDKPKDSQIIDTKWVYKKKSDNTYKTRLVARGFQQKESVENFYSPVGKLQTLNILLCCCCMNNKEIEQIDF